MKLWHFILFAVIIGGVFTWTVWNYTAQAPTINANQPQAQPWVSDMISVDSPKPYDTVGRTIMVSGQAKGNWYFEASFPVKVVAKNGEIIAQGIAQAQGDWMTENFVPFRALLVLNDTDATEADLILSRDNPSGLPENDKSISLPLKLKPLDPRSVVIYLGNKVFDPNVEDCSKVFPVERMIGDTPAVARAALTELLAGPTDTEEQSGYFTSINPGVAIQKLTIDNGVAKVDFDQTLEQAVGGSCRVSAIRSQIEQTLKQFSTVDSVVISINNRTEDILQP